MAPMHETVRPVCACVTSSATAMRNTITSATNALRLAMAVAGAGQTASAGRAASLALSGLRKHSQKKISTNTKQMPMMTPVFSMKSVKV